MINTLNMNFPDDNYPDFGSMVLDREGDLMLLGADVHKLNSRLTRAVCVGTYGADKFSFGTGDFAYAIDTERLFIYESTTDSWIEQEG